MSYQIAFYQPDEDLDDNEAGEHFYLATSSGLRDFIGWVALLPEAKYPALVPLCNSGQVRDTDALREQIKRALRAKPPRVEGVTQIGKNLLERIGYGDPEETAVVE